MSTIFGNDTPTCLCRNTIYTWYTQKENALGCKSRNSIKKKKNFVCYNQIDETKDPHAQYNNI